MFKKWAGWKKVAACLMGAALLMQSGSVAMGATETAKYSSTKAEKSSVKKAAAKDEKEEDSTDEEDSAEDEDSTEDTDSADTEDSADAEDSTEDTDSADAEDSTEDTDSTDAEDSTEDEDSTDAEDSTEDEDSTDEDQKADRVEDNDAEAQDAEGKEADPQSLGLSTTGSVDHIDIGALTAATLKVGDKTITQPVILTFEDIANASISGDAGFSADQSSLSGSVGVSGMAQIRVPGNYPVGTKEAPAVYSVSVTKDVTFVDPDTGATYVRTITFSTSFTYWDWTNDCPNLGFRVNWAAGYVIPCSGMDIVLGCGYDEIPAPEPTAVPNPTETPDPEPTVTETPDPEPTETPDTPDPTETPDPTDTPVPMNPTGTATPTPTGTATPVPGTNNNGTNGGNGTTTNGTTNNGTTTNTTSNNTTSTSSSDAVKTADNSHIAGYGMLVVFALLDAALAFFALRLRRRDD